VALVEFALLLPMLTILVFGVIDLGRALTTWNEAKGAAGAAADFAATAPYRQQDTGSCADPDNASFRGRTEGGNDFDFEFSPALPCTIGQDASWANYPDDPTDSDPDNKQPMTVTAVQDFALMTPMMEGLVGPLQVRSSVTVRISR
jgi:Flp pilus assembly protein TadG